MCGWSYADWRPGGERAEFGDVTLDSTLHCGNAHDFTRVASDHYRFRSRTGLAPYAWRFLFTIDSPGDGREITLEVADFNHEGRTPWHESATVWSDDGERWLPFPSEQLEIIEWTPTGHREIDAAYGDATHVPYGVRYRLRLDAPRIWFACPTPFTLDYRDRLLRELRASRPDVVEVSTVAGSAHSTATGYPVTMARMTGPGPADERRTLLVVAGEHAAETAGMYACEGFMREVLSHRDWLQRYDFVFVPILNVDGVLFGRTYFNVSPGITDSPGVNLSATWGERATPEQQGLWGTLERLRPELLVSLHNGRHRREMEQFADFGPGTDTINAALRGRLGFQLRDAGPPKTPARLPRKAMDRGLVRHGFLTETLLLERLPGQPTPRDSYVEVGRQLARGYVEGLDAL
ncbi:MAG: M14 family zinc carboxypeptidase [Armatimonadota bacterium]|nr:M14 family zinc carboxypeptidase [Armatimonadota bacterium]